MANHDRTNALVEEASLLTTLIHARRTVLPRRLAAPGPDARQLRDILEAAAAAPDHRELRPWRLVVIPEAARANLGEAFASALRERDALATAGQVEQAREKAFRAPLLLLAIVRTEDDDKEIPAFERVVSAGCAIQNMLLVATALGFGSALTSGKAMGSRALRELFALAPGEHALCLISVGTVASGKPGRPRPAVHDYVTELKP